jgi:hypothetical protein
MRRTAPVCSALMLAIAAVPMTVDASYYYEAVTRSEGDGPNHSSTVTAWVDGDKAMITFQQQDQTGLFSAGSYLLTTDGGATLYFVNPDERTYSEMDMEGLFNMIGNVMNAMGGMVRMEFTDFKKQKVSEAPGESILGYPTTHHHYDTGYTMSMSVLGMRNEMRTDTQYHFWCTPGFEGAGFDVWLRPDRFRTGHEELDQLIAQEFVSLDCLPLRTRAIETRTGGRGRATTTNTTTEVTVLREEQAPAGTFELPAGYEAQPLTALIPADLQEAMQGAPQQEPEERGGRRPRLRDLIR